MLPEVTLKSVSRDDVDRIAWWLQDEDLTSRWFGHYGADDPVHPGYDPNHMLEASDWEWRRTFGDSRRSIFSIYNTVDEHVGECQVQLDGEGGAEFVRPHWSEGPVAPRLRHSDDARAARQGL